MDGPERSISALNLPPHVGEFVAKSWGIKELYPPQAKALDSILSGKNTMVCIPTASGKSLVAFLGIMKRLLVTDKGSRAVYIVPLKALASEKYEDLSQLADAVGLTVGLGTGDATGESRNVGNADIIVCTSEKLDSLMRNRPDVVADVSVIVADEFHLLNDTSRGPTLEINLTRLKSIRPLAQLIALSATVGNGEELAKWLDADLIVSSWRPVSLEYSTLAELDLEPRAIQQSALITDSSALSAPRKLSGPKSMPTWAALKDVDEQGGQLLVFVSTRKSAQSEARKLAERMIKHLTDERKTNLQELSDKLSRSSSSVMGDILAKAVLGGVAFHHAGLTTTQRKVIESSFKSGDLAGLVATPTLAAGVNLPARRVLVRDIKRYQDGFNRLISVMEVRQMLGRAGRPGYDDQGQAWILSRGADRLETADNIAERYIHGDVENVVSKLSAEPALRFHLLSMIATGGLRSRHEIGEFFSSTFLGMTYPSVGLSEIIDKNLSWLVEERFIRGTGVDEDLVDSLPDLTENWSDDMPIWADVASSATGINLVENSSSPVTFGFTKASSRPIGNHYSEHHRILASTYESTQMGKMVAQLYLDPLSAAILLKGLRRSIRRKVRGHAPVSEFGLVHLAAATPDFPSFWAKASDMVQGSDLRLKAALMTEEILHDTVLEEGHLGLVKSAWCIEKWYEECELRDIEKLIGVTPGDVHHRVELLRWLMYAARELLLTDDVFAGQHDETVQELAKFLDKLRLRISAGCREDLLDLVAVKGIGRARARTLASFGVRSPKELLELGSTDLSRLKSLRGWGPKLVDNLLLQITKLSSAKSVITYNESDDEPLPGERQD